MYSLITAGLTAHAYHLEKALRIQLTVFFGDNQELPIIKSVSRKFIFIPAGDSVSFAHELLTICLDNEIDTVYPLRRKEVVPLAESRQLFLEYGIQVIIPEREEIEFLLSDLTTASKDLCVMQNGQTKVGNQADGTHFKNGIFYLNDGKPTLYIAD